MKTAKLTILLLLIGFKSLVYAQVNSTDSLPIERQSLNGYFSHNNQFCDKLEEFIDIISFFYSVENAPLILISNGEFNCDCKNDSLFVVRIEIKDLNSILSYYMKVNGNYVYSYGGKLKGRYIFLSQESIYGKLFRSEFGFMDVLKELFPSSFRHEADEDKFHEFKFASGNVIIGQPYMDIIVDRNGKIKNVKYCDYDYSKSSDAIIYNSVKEFRKLYEDAKATYNLKNESK